MKERFAETPEPPYYAVIFSSIKSEDDEGYGSMAEKMFELAREQPGYLGIETAQDGDRFGITVSYWRDEDSIAAWKRDVRHLAAQTMGIDRWYTHYEIRVAKVDRAYSGPAGRTVNSQLP